MEQELITYRVDDLPLLYSVIQSLGLGSAVNEYFKVHGNWVGQLPGEILELWLCYMLSQGDHRLSGAEEWAKNNLVLLQAISGHKELSSQDFSDDKLGLLLDYFSEREKWDKVETTVNGKLLSVYRLEEGSHLNTFRLDAAPMQCYGKPGELLEYGYHKHHANLPQFKLKLCTLDNEVNHFAYPVCHLTVGGKISDDELYIPIIEQSKKVLGIVPAFAFGNLYVGDSKFGSIGNRLFVEMNKDYYLLPLSNVQLSAAKKQELIAAAIDVDYQKVYRTEKKKEVLVAEGFEMMKEMEVESEGKIYRWQERRVFVHSINYAQNQEASLEKKILRALTELKELPQPKQGKKKLTTKEAYQTAIDDILIKHKVTGLIAVQLDEKQTKITKRAYGDLPKRTEIKSEFELTGERKEAAITEQKKYMGWQIYATNAPKYLLPFEKCVWKYRYQTNIESRFDDIRNKVVPLLPVFLQKDNRIKGLVNVLLLALKVCSMMEYKTAKNLQDQKELLDNIYEGNPNRETDRPSIKRTLTPFKGITIAVIFDEGNFQLALMTKLKPVQKKILHLLELDQDIYSGLAAKMKLFFSNKNIIET